MGKYVHSVTGSSLSRINTLARVAELDHAGSESSIFAAQLTDATYTSSNKTRL